MKKVRIGVNDGLMIGYIILILFEAVSCGAIAALVFGCFPQYPKTSIPWGIFICLLFLCFPAVCIADPHRTGFAWLTFVPEGIEYHALFRRKKVRPYSDYPYWSHGRYLHVAVVVDFIVLSKRKLSTRELDQINDVRPSADLIKIRYKKKTYQKLLGILPEKQKLLLRCAIPK